MTHEEATLQTKTALAASLKKFMKKSLSAKLQSARSSPTVM